MSSSCLSIFLACGFHRGGAHARTIKISFFATRHRARRKLGNALALPRARNIPFFRDGGWWAEIGPTKFQKRRIASYRCNRARCGTRAVKNDIKFKSSLNKKSLSEARERIIHTAENSKSEIPTPARVGFSIINFNVVPDKKAKRAPTSGGERKRRRRRDLVG